MKMTHSDSETYCYPRASTIAGRLMAAAAVVVVVDAQTFRQRIGIARLQAQKEKTRG
jgi:hypothetical protein